MKRFIAFLKDHNALATLAVVLLGIAFFVLLTNLEYALAFIRTVFSVLAPVTGGAVTAYILSGAVNFLELRVFGGIKNRKAASGLAVAVTVLLAVGLFTLLTVTALPQLIASVQTLFGSIEGYFNAFTERLTSWADGLGTGIDVSRYIGTWREITLSVTEWISANAGSIMGGAVKVGSGIVDAVLAAVLAVYILLERKSLKASLTGFLEKRMKPQSYRRGRAIYRLTDAIMKGYIGGNLLDTLIIGIANLIFMMVLGMPYSLLITVIVMITNLIPTFGPFIGAVPSVLLLLLIDPMDALWFIIWTLALQAVDGYLLKPLILKDSTGLSPFWVLVAIVVGGRLAGIAGMLLGIPILAVISALIDASGQSRRAER